MPGGSAEERLRSLPGVLECVVTDDQVVLLLHPEVDGRALKVRAADVCAATGETKSLLLVGGLAAAGTGAGAAPATTSSSLMQGRVLPLAIVGILVIALLSLMPLVDGDDDDRGAASLGEALVVPSLKLTEPPATTGARDDLRSPTDDGSPSATRGRVPLSIALAVPATTTPTPTPTATPAPTPPPPLIRQSTAAVPTSVALAPVNIVRSATDAGFEGVEYVGKARGKAAGAGQGRKAEAKGHDPGSRSKGKGSGKGDHRRT